MLQIGFRGLWRQKFFRHLPPALNNPVKLLIKADEFVMGVLRYRIIDMNLAGLPIL